MGDVEGQSGLESFVVFLDENHCRNPHLLAALTNAGVRCEKHLDHFNRGLEDTAWIPFVAERGWCLLTADARIRYNQLERRAVQENGLRMFYFSNNNMAGSDMGQALTKALPKMVRLFERQPAPFAASISRSGDVNLRTDFQQDVIIGNPRT
jgi:hypothetical protein